MISTNLPLSRTLVTGATGFIGHYILAELLRNGHACTAIVRAPHETSEGKLYGLLRDLKLDPDELRDAGLLNVVEGSLPDQLPSQLPAPIDRIIHAAGSTRFDSDVNGDPARTNDEGTLRLLEFAEKHHITEFHLVSTAFVCGKVDGIAGEQFTDPAPEFHNAYEHSKWHAELHAHRWSQHDSRSLTVYRPSIVVGDFDSGRATRYSGPYLMFRACELLGLSVGDDPVARHNFNIRIEGSDTDPVNVVPVDYVAKIIAGVVANRELHNQTYHLVHPQPLTNGQLRDATDQWFDIAGGQFVESSIYAATKPNDLERHFHSIIQPIRPYIMDAPQFDRTNIELAEHALGIKCPTWDNDAIHRLIRYAQNTKWGRKRSVEVRSDEACAVYFERFLPNHIPNSQVARVASLTTTARFVIEDIPDGHWVCRFENGQLTGVHRGQNGIAEEFAYRMDEAAFWEVVTGTIDPQTIFLDGRVEITGDIEQALKMGAILQAFNQEHPCDRTTLVATHGGGSDV